MFDPPTQSVSRSTVFSRVMGGTICTVAVAVAVSGTKSIAVNVAVLVMSAVMVWVIVVVAEPNGGISLGGGIRVPNWSSTSMTFVAVVERELEAS
jgi:hypothetical protein